MFTEDDEDDYIIMGSKRVTSQGLIEDIEPNKVVEEIGYSLEDDEEIIEDVYELINKGY